MITGEFKSKVDRIWDTMWSGGISNPLSVIEQLTYLLFIKRLDELHTLREHKAARTGKAVEEPIYGQGQDHLRWSRFKETAPETMFATVKDEVFPFIKSLGGNGGTQEEGDSTYSHHLLDHPRLVENRFGQQVLEAGLMQQRTQALIVGHPQPRVVTVQPVDHRLQREAGVEAGRPRIAHDVAFRLAGWNREFAKISWQEGEVAHVLSKLPVESAGLKGCKQGVQFGEVGAHAGFLLFDPEDDKQDFRAFDFCFNFDFFRENPEGINTVDSAPLGTRLFRARVQLLGHVQTNSELDPDAALRNALTDSLYGEVDAMNRENFIVRMHLETVERFQNRGAWEQLSESDREILQREVAGLPSEIATDDIESRLFDLTALRMQLALVEGDEGAFEQHRKRVVKIAMLLEEKGTIPAVAAQLEYIAGVQESAFWEGISLAELEDLRLRLRGLVPFLDKKKRKIVYTDFKDQVLGVREEQVVSIPKMTGAQYAKKVNDYLRNHLNHFVIYRLRTNKPLTALDLKGLETSLVEIGEEDGETLLSDLLARSEAPSLAHFVRSLVGLDRTAAQAAFSQFLNDRSLTPQQIRFVEMVIDQLTARGVMDAYALYEPPFSDLHAGGPDELFAGKENVINAVFLTLESLEPRIMNVA